MKNRNHEYPGMPWRQYGPIPMAPEPGDVAGPAGAVTPPPLPPAPAAKVEAVDPAPAAEKKAEAVVPPAAEKKAPSLAEEVEAKEKFVERLAALDNRIEISRRKEVLAHLRRMGADPELVSDDDLLELAPKVDPLLDEAAATAELLKFKEKRKKWFTPLAVGPQEDLARYGERLKTNTKLTDDDRAKRAKLAARLGGNR